MKTEEYSILIVKPEALREFRGKIFPILKAEGLKAIESRNVILNEEVLKNLYEHTTRLHNHFQAIKAHLGGEAVLVIKVWGKGSISKLTTLVGIYDDPRQCASTSLRYRLSLLHEVEPIEIKNGLYYYRNGFDAPLNEAQFRRFDALLFSPNLLVSFRS